VTLGFEHVLEVKERKKGKKERCLKERCQRKEGKEENKKGASHAITVL
jgi:hypothetical protein